MPEKAWLEALARAFAPLVDEGVGVHVVSAQIGADRHALHEPLLVGGTTRWQRSWRENWWEPVMTRLDTAALRSLFTFGAVSSAQQLWDAAARGVPSLDAHLRVLARHGWAHAFGRETSTDERRLFYVDSLNLTALEGGRAVAIVANREERLDARSIARARAELAPAVAHLSAALRARGRLRGRAPTADDAEAVLTPDGRLLHAEGSATASPARGELRRAARDIDRARARHAPSRGDVTTLWRCMVAGRWSLLDEFDHDGRRFLLAVPNEAESPRATLSRREAQVLRELAKGRSNKEIAYALGLTPSTVATLVARAGRKRRVRSRVELVLQARALFVDCDARGQHQAGICADPAAGARLSS